MKIDARIVRKPSEAVVPLSAGQTANDRKAILVVSFGTTYPEARQAAIDQVTAKIRLAFPEYTVRQAFTSRRVIERINTREGIRYLTEEQALAALAEEGFRELVVQPLHMEAGYEYDKVRRVVETYRDKQAFENLYLGRPLLYYAGQEGVTDDYLAAIQAVRRTFPPIGPQEAIALLGHGGLHPANAVYAALQLKLQDAGIGQVYVFTVDGYPAVEDLVRRLAADGVRKVTLIPLLLVAGEHARRDMAGDEPDSFRSRLQDAGFEVSVCLQGVGENPAIQDIYVQHVKDAIAEKKNFS